MKNVVYDSVAKMIYMKDSKLYLSVDNESHSFNIILDEFPKDMLLRMNTLLIGSFLIELDPSSDSIIRIICNGEKSKEINPELISRSYFISGGIYPFIDKSKEDNLREFATLLNYNYSFVLNTVDISIQEFISSGNLVLSYGSGRYTIYIENKKLLEKLSFIKRTISFTDLNHLMRILLSKVENLRDSKHYDNFVWSNCEKNFDFKDMSYYNPKSTLQESVVLTEDQTSVPEQCDDYCEYEYEYECVDDALNAV